MYVFLMLDAVKQGLVDTVCSCEEVVEAWLLLSGAMDTLAALVVVLEVMRETVIDGVRGGG